MLFRPGRLNFAINRTSTIFQDHIAGRRISMLREDASSRQRAGGAAAASRRSTVACVCIAALTICGLPAVGRSCDPPPGRWLLPRASPRPGRDGGLFSTVCAARLCLRARGGARGNDVQRYGSDDALEKVLAGQRRR